MYHGIPTNYDFYVIVFGILAWIARSIAKAARQVRQRGIKPPQAAVPPVQSLSAAPPQIQSPQVQSPQSLSSQVLPARAPRLDAPRLRQPAAGGPAVPKDATRTDMEQQEQALFFSEPAALNSPLTSMPPSAAPARRLLSGPDDLIRAIILQEVLGPPLSRRSARQPQPPAPSPEPNTAD